MAISDFLSPLQIGANISNDFDSKDHRKMLRQNYQAAMGYQPGLTESVNAAGIRGAAAGAKQAGLHPLFALGGGTQGGQPAMVGGTPSGSGITAQTGIGSNKASRLEEANVELVKKNTEWVQEQIDASRASRLDTNSNQDTGPITHKVTYEEPVVSTHLPDKPGQRPGKHPAWTQHDMSFGGIKFKMWAPAKEVSEIFESVGMWPVIYGAQPEVFHKLARDLLASKSNIAKLGKFAQFIVNQYLRRR